MSIRNMAILAGLSLILIVILGGCPPLLKYVVVPRLILFATLPSEAQVQEMEIYISNVIDVNEQNKIIQILKEITQEHVFITSEVTLTFVRTRMIPTESGSIEAVYDVESQRYVTLID